MGAGACPARAPRPGAVATGGSGAREADVRDVLPRDGPVQRGSHHHAQVMSTVTDSAKRHCSNGWLTRLLCWRAWLRFPPLEKVKKYYFQMVFDSIDIRWKVDKLELDTICIF